MVFEMGTQFSKMSRQDQELFGYFLSQCSPKVCKAIGLAYFHSLCCAQNRTVAILIVDIRYKLPAVVTAPVSLTLLIALITRCLSQFQQLVDGLFYDTTHQFLEFTLDYSFV